MASRTIAIGDIHGCLAAFDALLEAMDLQADDRLVTLGDYVDRGPDSRGVIERLCELADRCELIPLMGNHEVMMLDGLRQRDHREFWLAVGGQATVDSYGSIDEIPAEHIEFIGNCHRFYESDSHIFVHANYAANLPMARQTDERVFWEHVNSAYLPRPHASGKTVVVGHTPQRDVADHGHLICLDTGCFAGGWLTAMDVVSRRIWQATENGQLREQPAGNE